MLSNLRKKHPPFEGLEPVAVAFGQTLDESSDFISVQMYKNKPHTLALNVCAVFISDKQQSDVLFRLF